VLALVISSLGSYHLVLKELVWINGALLNTRGSADSCFSEQ
jgi:hypothetical protein